MSLTGFAKSNNLIENEQDRLAIQNLFPSLSGISNDVALLVNNLRNESLLEINKFKPQYIVTLIGFETFENDISFLNKLKSKFPNIKIIGFGHYPTIFSHEILKKSTIDFIVQGEPEYELADFFDSISTNSNILPEGLLSLNSENEKTPRLSAQDPDPSYSIFIHYT